MLLRAALWSASYCLVGLLSDILPLQFLFVKIGKSLDSEIIIVFGNNFSLIMNTYNEILIIVHPGLVLVYPGPGDKTSYMTEGWIENYSQQNLNSIYSLVYPISFSITRTKEGNLKQRGQNVV